MQLFCQRWSQYFIEYLQGIYLAQFFADLKKGNANQYLHHVDSDKLLICEIYAVAQNTTAPLADNNNIVTSKADAILNNLAVDRFSNINLEIEMNNLIHKLTLNTKVTRNFGLDQIRRSLFKTMKSFKYRLSQCWRKYKSIYNESIIYLSQISFRFS